jgi:hypothetical protein
MYVPKDDTKRCDTLTAHMVTHAKVNKEVVSEITHSAQEVSTFMEEM